MTMAEWEAFLASYLLESGREVVRRGELHDWIEARPHLPAHAVIFAKTEAAAARAYRLDLIGRIIASVRLITIDVTPAPSAFRVVENRVETTTIRTYHCPPGGLGQRPTNVDLAEHRAALALIASKALLSWHRQHLGAAVLVGVDLQPVVDLADALDRAAALQKD